ncbi:TetM/TetW/TetO/TetS family tetracycline resistance ribosomal protection protein [Phytohabitans sp. ZYX-F-186]|uniref:TetM/TetW/TetO/TetS family tetracycline resistance ribosomal protection protein n=1 Tax=Phytohabitans maris TaxID=3071409 RepID=A0ABU0ZRT4_9ACTN|nr:TetM/TetW/TetO/TetS family tetracycline resistance ribosomal protection protein [Phytohabitans sp. ZYX-F-186]MDQ7908662.1 TetM/TetW/TetO/TetS family tetracycline resistance ribosomal protection protein [Phytohabitans sp. ZYX-F-186]
MSTLNLGILAHVDAGKTSLTERLLYEAGVIDEIGSVDAGSTQTDSMALERQRGITIRSAVVSFAIGDVTVNLIDTPGHPDFIAEVERVLSVLDGAVLVVSAVEGVQAQTRVLMRTLRRLRIPTLLFVNKVDRVGARYAGLLADLAEKLTAGAVPMGTVAALGTRDAAFVPDGAALVDALTRHDDALLAAYVADERTVTPRRLRSSLAAATGTAAVHPVFFGSAITGAGVPALMQGIAELLPAAAGDPRGPLSGTVFKVERGPAGEKVAYVRVFSGTVRTRDRLRDDGKVTAIGVFDRGGTVRADEVPAGRIGKLWGLGGVRIGDPVGTPHGAAAHHFAPPSLETVVVPARPADKGALHTALTQLAEQDPLIDLRQDPIRQEISVSLYGEVQKEVIQATLAGEYGIDVAFRESATICVERPAGSGAAAERMGEEGNPFLATVGLRVDPAPAGSGVGYRLEVELGSMPYAFMKAVEDTVRETLEQGLRGWRVTDCVVTMTHSGYAPRQSHAHATFDKSMSSTGFDFRGLTPLVLMTALSRAGTVVHEPLHRFRLEFPAGTYGTLLPVLVRLGGIPGQPDLRGPVGVLEGEIPAARVHELQQRLPGLTRGEGVVENMFNRYAPVRGPAPGRARWDANPLDRKEYLLRVMRRVP